MTKTLYKGGKFVAKVSCDPPSGHEDLSFEVTWYILKLACWKGYFETEEPVCINRLILIKYKVHILLK